MTKNEIPIGTRAIMFCFTCVKGTPRVTFDLVDSRYVGKRYSELESMAISAVLKSGYLIHQYKAHFIE